MFNFLTNYADIALEFAVINGVKKAAAIDKDNTQAKKDKGPQVL